MGAYYEPVIKIKKDNKEEYYLLGSKYGERYWDWNGLKLMEHGFIFNDYVNTVLSILNDIDNPKELGWLCDYYDGNIINSKKLDNYEELWNKEFDWIQYFNINKKYFEKFKKMRDWGDIDVKAIKNRFNILIPPPKFINNISKGVYLDIDKWIKIVVFASPTLDYQYEEYLVHPIVLLTNSQTEDSGGGDFHLRFALRGSWFLDEIITTYNNEQQKEVEKLYGVKDGTNKIIDEYLATIWIWNG